MEKGSITQGMTQSDGSSISVYLPAVSFAGVQIGWAVMTGHATAHLRKLGLPDSDVGFAWLAGPVTGVLVQPVVGVFSDRCISRFGRRRPFIAVGGIGILLGFLTFGFAEQIMGGRGAGAIAVGIAAFWFADAAINVVQTPSRALLADVADGDNLVYGSATFGVASGVGKCIGYGLGAFLPSAELTFSVAGAVILALVVLTVTFSHDDPLRMKAETSALDTLIIAYRKMHHLVRNPPNGLRGVFYVQWLTYFSVMLMLIYGADWVGKDVFGGSGDAPRGSPGREAFEEGVRFANAGFLLSAAISIVFSALLPFLRQMLHLRIIWAGCLLPMAIALLCSLLPMGRASVLLIFAAQGSALAAAFSLPWEVVSRTLSGRFADDKGLCLAMFNLAQAAPGAIASVVGGLLIRLGKARLGSMLFAAGCVMTGAVALVLIVDLPRESPEEEDVEYFSTANKSITQPTV